MRRKAAGQGRAQRARFSGGRRCDPAGRNGAEIGVPRGTVRNAVGAGDSMVAGFLAGYLKLGTYSYALRMGAAAGSATAFSDELATKEEILKLLNTF